MYFGTSSLPLPEKRQWLVDPSIVVLVFLSTSPEVFCTMMVMARRRISGASIGPRTPVIYNTVPARALGLSFRVVKVSLSFPPAKSGRWHCLISASVSKLY